MRRWIPVTLIALAILWFVLQNLGSSMALSDIAARPILALTKDGQRIPVQQPGAPVAAGEARATGGAGIAFGYALIFTLADGSPVTCTHRFRSASCSDGWQAERAPAD